MKLNATIDGGQHEVDLRPDLTGLVARVDDREYKLTSSEPQRGVLLLKSEGKVYEASTSVISNGVVVVKVGGREFEVSITDPTRLRGSDADAEHGSGRVEIKTAMPGKVVRLLCQPGHEVQKGDGVIVVEAMKMQNEMRAPRAGTVSDVRAGEGDTVGAGDILVVID